jgi:hypothetical protein
MLAVAFHSVGEFCAELGYDRPKCIGVARRSFYTIGTVGGMNLVIGFKVMVPREGEVLVLDLPKVVSVRVGQDQHEIQQAALKSYLADVEAALKGKGLEIRGGAYKTI